MRARLSTFCLVVVTMLTTGCGGATHVRTLPDSESAAIELIPSDAFFVGRFDGNALRATPQWAALAASFAEQRGEELHRILTGTDRVYVAVGGLVSAPLPPRDAAAEETSRPPPWAEIAAVFGGKIPKMVAVVEGDAASLCALALSQGPTREEHGYRYGTRDGMAILMKGTSLCAMTLEPIVPHLLADSGSRAPVLGRLASVGENGDLGIVTMAFELDSPAFTSIVESARDPDGQPSEENTQIANIVRRVFAILLSGIDAVEWQIARNDVGYTSRARIHASDRDRGTMWRELTEMYLDIFRAVVDSGIGELRTYASGVMDQTRIEEHDDGYTLVSGISDASISSLIEALSTTTPLGEAAAVAISAPPIDNVQGSSEEIIASLEPRADELIATGAVIALDELASAYASRARFADAKQLLRRAVESAADRGSKARLAARLCELELETGHAAEAMSVASAALERCASDGCDYLEAPLHECRFVARAMSGDTQVLADMETTPIEWSPAPSEAPQRFGSARGRVLLALGRYLEAAASFNVVCAGGNVACQDHAANLAEATTRSSLDLDAARIAIERAGVATRYMPVNARTTADIEARLRTLECIAQSSRAPASDTARTACSAAVELTTTTHGALHPRTAEAALGYAHALAAARDTAGVARELAKVDAVLATLGPAHHLRAERASMSATPARPTTRPRR